MLIKKIKKVIYSLFCFIKNKLIYGNRISISNDNLLEGKFNIYIDKKSKCKIGKRLCTEGPTYIKAIDNSEIIIGDNCYFNHNCSITSLKSIKIGDGCMFGNNVTIVDHDHLIKDRIAQKKEFKKKEIIIGNNVWIGANVTILKGVKIGDNTVIAAGSVVNSSIPNNEIWAGIPAKKVK